MEEKFINLCWPKKDEKDDILWILPKINLSAHSDTKIKVNCHFIDYNDSNQRRNDYFEFINDTLLNYMLTRKELKWAEHPKDWKKLNTDAKSKIWDILKKEDEKSDGLLWEWNLYLLLEYLENAKKLVSRMSLDTSTQWNRKWLDLVHFKLHEWTIYIYLWESKIYKNIDGAIKDALLSINTFFLENRYKNEQITIIKQHLDLSQDKELEDFLLDTKFFTPSSTIEHKEILSIFIMFDSKELEDIEKIHDEKFITKEELIKDIKNYYKQYIESEIYKIIDDTLKLQYLKKSWIKKTKEEIEQDIENWIESPKKTKTIEVDNKIKNKNFIFYFIPVKNVEELRIDFKKHIMKN